MNARSKDVVTAIACTTLPNNVALPVGVEKKTPMFFKNVIVFAAE